MPSTPPCVLAVAGSDSGGGAGLQADLKTMLALGVHGMSVVCAVTAQNSVGVQGYWELPLAAIRAQLDSVLGDIGVQAVKTGMLASPAIVETVAERAGRPSTRRSWSTRWRCPSTATACCRAGTLEAIKRGPAAAGHRGHAEPVEAELLTGEQITDEDGMRRGRRGSSPRWARGGSWSRAATCPATRWTCCSTATDVIRFPGRAHRQPCTRTARAARWPRRSPRTWRMGMDVPAAVEAAKEYVTGRDRGRVPARRRHRPGRPRLADPPAGQLGNAGLSG